MSQHTTQHKCTNMCVRKYIRTRHAHTHAHMHTHAHAHAHTRVHVQANTVERPLMPMDINICKNAMNNTRNQARRCRHTQTSANTACTRHAQPLRSSLHLPACMGARWTIHSRGADRGTTRLRGVSAEHLPPSLLACTSSPVWLGCPHQLQYAL